MLTEKGIYLMHVLNNIPIFSLDIVKSAKEDHFQV